jgi:hypothetical protein
MMMMMTINHHHHHSEYGQGLGLKTCSFEAQGVPGPSILLSVFPYSAIPEIGTGKPASVGGFYPFVQGGLPISFVKMLRISGFLWRSNLVSPNSGLRNLICAASSFWASRLFMIQFSRS